ncbi:MAG: FixH family protein [Betaproteobacteria bacterium]|nr:FixH family protein [Betaproteobacteria bacterium]
MAICRRVLLSIGGLACLLTLAACTSTPPPPALDLSLTRASPNNHFRITLIPPQGTTPIQQIHSWTVKVATPTGEPATKALVYMNGGMPEHGHGMPTRPAVTREIAPGTYLVEGVKFNMSGWWELLVAVQLGPASDVTTFNYIVPLPAHAK